MTTSPNPQPVDEGKKQLTSKMTCKKKHMYHSKETAKRAKKRRNKAAGIEYLREYKCNVCDFWHVTTQRKVEL